MSAAVVLWGDAPLHHRVACAAAGTAAFSRAEQLAELARKTMLRENPDGQDLPYAPRGAADALGGDKGGAAGSLAGGGQDGEKRSLPGATQSMPGGFSSMLHAHSHHHHHHHQRDGRRLTTQTPELAALSEDSSKPGASEHLSAYQTVVSDPSASASFTSLLSTLDTASPQLHRASSNLGPPSAGLSMPATSRSSSSIAELASSLEDGTRDAEGRDSEEKGHHSHFPNLKRPKLSVPKLARKHKRNPSKSSGGSKFSTEAIAGEQIDDAALDGGKNKKKKKPGKEAKKEARRARREARQREKDQKKLLKTIQPEDVGLSYEEGDRGNALLAAIALRESADALRTTGLSDIEVSSSSSSDSDSSSWSSSSAIGDELWGSYTFGRFLCLLAIPRLAGVEPV